MSNDMSRTENSVSKPQFPEGMPVLVVDNDTDSLTRIGNILRECKFHVTTTDSASKALDILNGTSTKYDIVLIADELSDDCLVLLQLLNQMGIPFILMSTTNDRTRVMQAIKHGACDYLVKPLRCQGLMHIWKHVAIKNNSISLSPPALPVTSVIESERPRMENQLTETADDEKCKGKMVEESSKERNNDENGLKYMGTRKIRLLWSQELHQKFIDAVRTLGIERAYPKNILRLMNEKGLTKAKVASHLQKYRLYLKKKKEGVPHFTTPVFDQTYPCKPGGAYGVFSSRMGASFGYPGISSPFPATFGQLNNASQLSNSNTRTPLFSTPTTTFLGFPPYPLNNAAFINPQPNPINQNTINLPIGGLNGIDNTRFLSNWGNFVPSSNNTPNLDTTIEAQTQNVQSNPLPYLCGYTPVTNSAPNLRTNDLSLNSNGSNILDYLGYSKTLDPFNISGSSSSQISFSTRANQTVNQNNANTSVQSDGAIPPFQHQNQIQQSNAELDMMINDLLLDDQMFTGASCNGPADCLADVLELLREVNHDAPKQGL